MTTIVPFQALVSQVSCMSQHRDYMRCMLCSHFHFFAGELPKELGQLTNLTFFDVADNSIGGELYVSA